MSIQTYHYKWYRTNIYLLLQHPYGVLQLFTKILRTYQTPYCIDNLRGRVWSYHENDQGKVSTHTRFLLNGYEIDLIKVQWHDSHFVQHVRLILYCLIFLVACVLVVSFVTYQSVHSTIIFVCNMYIICNRYQEQIIMCCPSILRVSFQILKIFFIWKTRKQIKARLNVFCKNAFILNASKNLKL